MTLPIAFSSSSTVSFFCFHCFDLVLGTSKSKSE